MKNGTCPKCRKKSVHVVLTNEDSIWIASLRTAFLSQFVCVECGYVEFYVQDESLLPKIAQVTQKISSENVLGLED